MLLMLVLHWLNWHVLISGVRLHRAGCINELSKPAFQA
jgi:hypothetical protein